MPGIVPPPIRNQVATKDKDRFELCGESCVAAALGENVETVVAWLRGHEGERFVQNGTTTDSLINYCAARGVGARVVYGPAKAYVAAAVNRGHYALVLVWSDHAGKPVPHADSQRLHKPGGIGHWMLGYGVEGATVLLMQPFGGTHVKVNLDRGQDQHLGIEVNRKVGAGAPGQPAPKPAKKPVSKPASRTAPKPPPKPSGVPAPKEAPTRTAARGVSPGHE